MFEGFDKEVIDFLWGIRFNNEKTWFEAHKQEYLTLLYRPMRALADEVYGRFLEHHRDLDLIHRVSRIYRDARRLHGRGPYKDRLWWSMERPEENWTGQSVFWFELEPEGYSYGLGYWMAPPVTMAKFRARLDRQPKPFEKLARAFAKQDTFVLEGEDYKRPLHAPSPLLAPWYQKKTFALTHAAPHDDLLWRHELVDVLCAGFEQLLPIYRFLLEIQSDPDPRT
jgi:uncharacterized protein (TIGR02453 family)